MIREVEIVVKPEEAFDSALLFRQFIKQHSVRENEICHFSVFKRSLDARGKELKYRVKIKFSTDEKYSEPKFDPDFKNVNNSTEVHIIGAGPAGYFAALKLLQKGIKPVLFDRGKNVRARRRDLVSLTREGIVNPESNYCFGEGGAGTYSDGKLYTRSTKRGDVNEILKTLVHFGASPDILIDAHPHIGTNKLPDIITKMRECIEEFGGEVHFESKLTDIDFDSNGLQNITINGNQKIKISKLILATGHSARDIFELLHKKKIFIEEKPFALGVRAEHPQELIDKFRYRCDTRPENIPPASYSLVEQVNGLGVYSFCMCPGGIIAPCSTSPGEVVTNGWSPSKRNNPFANSGIVVSVTSEMTASFKKFGPLAGMYFQSSVEQKAFEAGGNNLNAPAARMVDFFENKISTTLPDCSYKPGIVSASLKNVLPVEIHSRLQKAFKEFDKSMKGYFTNEAVVVGVESRTSSPVRIPRDEQTLEHPQIKGLYPCGEGAGYAGGIVSAAIDGMRCADKC
jgi:uncharacterized FAD-dependent dehydrogenase